MKPLVRLALFPLVAAMLHAAPGPDFQSHLGLQLYSLRVQFKENTLAALDLAKSYGVTEVETAGTGSLTPEQFTAELKARGLEAVSGHWGYAALEKDVAAVIRDAKTLGVKFVICPYPKLDKERNLTGEIAHEMAANFNQWGEACRAAGLRFGYHPHGLEFRPTGGANGETAFDILMSETKPDLVCYEMDVFWAYHAGQDPVKLLTQHPNRWRLIHVKDMRKGALTGVFTGSTAPTDKVTVGTGQINWPDVLRAARKAGVEHYFLEDETPTPLQCIPDSLKYLRGLKL